MKSVFLILCILITAIPVFVPAAAAENATPKAVVLDLSFHNGVIDVIGSRIVNNYPPDNRASREILIRMLDAEGALLAEQGIGDPRVAYLEEGAVIRESVNFSVIVPFRKDLATISLVHGESGAMMLSADVSGSVKNYCSGHGSDPDCAAGTSPLLFGGIGIGVLLLAGAGYYLFRKKTTPEEKKAGP